MPFGQATRAGDLRWSHVLDRESVSCSPPRAATARASTGRSSRSRRRWSTYGAAGLRPQADRAQQARRRDPARSAARSSSRRPTRCPRARRSSSRRTASRRSCTRRPRARSLKTIDATCPLVTKVHHEARPVRRRRLRHPADRPRGSRGGRRHDRRGARPHPPGRRAGRRRPHRGARPGEGRLALADHAVRRRDPRDGASAARAVPRAARPAERRHLLRHPEPAGRGEGDRGRRRPGHRRRVDELVELGAAGRGRPRDAAPRTAGWSTRPPSSTRRGSTA